MITLGLIVQSDLRWGAQCREMVSRASKCTWVLRMMRALGVDTPTLVEYWKTKGRVHLEFACPVWHSGLTVAQSHSLDMAQRMAMVAMVGWNPSHTQQLSELGLERLSSRREQLCARFAQRTATKSRHTNMFHLVTNNRNNKRNYREPMARTAAYYNSALPYLNRLLNSST